jgi:hypothetical protein
MDRRRKLRRLRVGKRLFVLVVRKWRHENADAQITGQTDRLKRIDAKPPYSAPVKPAGSWL